MGFGYIGTEPTNNNTENNGVFTVEELNDLSEKGELASSSFSCDFLVVAGGGAGGPGNVCGGGGGGGVISSVTMNGGGSTADSALTLSTGIDYDVRVGAGGSNNEYVGHPTIFFTKKAIGGGRGWRSNRSIDSAVGGGGGYAPFGWTNYGQPTLSQLSDEERIALTGSASKQGYRGSNTGYESYNSAGGGGGAGANGTTTTTGSNGTYHSLQSQTNQASSGAGEWHNNTNTYFGAGGGSGANSGTSGGYGGGGNGGTNSGNAGDANTGGGGGGRFTTSGYNGGSGAIVLKYPDTYTCTAGVGVTGAEYDEGDGNKTFVVTAGAGTISWVKG